MRLDSQHYYEAALERVRQSRRFYERGDGYAVTMYLAGVSVECLLRAFKLRRSNVIDERHDLPQLFDASGIMTIARVVAHRRGHEVPELREAMVDVASLWANDFRYASDQRLRKHLRFLRRHAGIKGDWLKANALRSLSAAEELVNAGATLWKHYDEK